MNTTKGEARMDGRKEIKRKAERRNKREKEMPQGKKTA